MPYTSPTAVAPALITKSLSLPTPSHTNDDKDIDTSHLPQLIPHSQGRPGHRRSYSSQAHPHLHPHTHQHPHNHSYNFTNERGSGTFASLGSLPRRTVSTSSAPAAAATAASASAAKRFHFRGGSDDPSSSEVSDNDDEGTAHNTRHIVNDEDEEEEEEERRRALPPLKLKVRSPPLGARPSSPASFGLRLNTALGNAVPFPRSSPLSSPLPGSPAASGLLSPLSPGSTASIKTLPTHSLDTRNPTYLAPPSANPNPKSPSPQRTSSSPVILLSNGKPLKSSLKSSSSTSNIPHHHTQHHPHHPHVHQNQSYHLRARSAPSTPGLDLLSSPESVSPSTTPSGASTPKNVHFPSLSSDLERVRVFNRSAKPASLLASRGGAHLNGNANGGSGTGAGGNESGNAEETETETEGEQSSGGVWGMGTGVWGGSALWGAASASTSGRWGSSAGAGAGASSGKLVAGFPFPRVPSPPKSEKKVLDSTSGEKSGYAYEIDTAGYPFPQVDLARLASDANANANVLIESIKLVDEGGLHLKGTILVRNVAYEKSVVVRFTLDEWSTVSEVRAGWAESVEGTSSQSHRTVGDIVAASTSSSSSSSSNDTSDASKTWDRFMFMINLEDYRAKLEGRVVWLVGRYNVPGGEWWDNCNGRNWRVGFRKVWGQTKVKGLQKGEDQEDGPTEERIERAGVEPRVGRVQLGIGRRGVSLSAPAATLTQPPPEVIAATVAAAAAGFIVVPGTTTTTPTTETLSTPSTPPLSPLTKSTSLTVSTSPTSPTPSTTSTSSATSPSTPQTPQTPPPPDRAHVEAVTNATMQRLRKFSLSNYVAPGVAVAVPSREGEKGKETTDLGKAEKEEKKEEGKGTEQGIRNVPEVPDVSAKKRVGFGLYWPWGTGSKESQQKQEDEGSPTPPAAPTLPARATVEIVDSPISPTISSNSSLPSPSPSPLYMPTPIPTSTSTSTHTHASAPSADDVPPLERSGSISSASTSLSSSTSSVDSLFLRSPTQGSRVGAIELDGEEIGYVGLREEDMKTPVPGGDKYGFGSWGGGEEEEGEVDEEGEGESDTSPNAGTGTVTVTPFRAVSISPPPPSTAAVTAQAGVGNRPNPNAINSESLYEAFVRQWCFAESAPTSTSRHGHGHGRKRGHPKNLGLRAKVGDGHGDEDGDEYEYEYAGGSLGLEVGG